MLKILIVDDHSIIRKGLRQILTEEYPSAVIDEARDAEEVTRFIVTNSYNIIICDLSLPVGSGLDVVEHIKRFSPKTPVLILSIHPEEQYAIRVLKAGAAGYLNKATAPEELVVAVQRVLLGRKYISDDLACKIGHDFDLYVSRPSHKVHSNREYEIINSIANVNSISEIAAQPPE